MKLTIFALLVVFVIPSQATISLNVQFGVATDSSGVSVADGTLWALVADTDDNNIFTGFGLNSNLSDSAMADTYFNVNQPLAIGQSIDGDVVVAMGAFNGSAEFGVAGVISTLLADMAYDSSPTGTGVAENRDFAFYWFPAATYTGAGSYSIATNYSEASIGNQVGGINVATADAGAGTGAMVFPSDGSLTDPIGANTSELGGSVANSSFQAVMIPEPSALALLGLGSLFLLRRKRTS